MRMFYFKCILCILEYNLTFLKYVDRVGFGILFVNPGSFGFEMALVHFYGGGGKINLFSNEGLLRVPSLTLVILPHFENDHF